ncbi:MAG: sporulation protein YhbH [Bacillota bacterium]|nr:sporulation protein YhbH [Bacillota bacterium]
MVKEVPFHINRENWSLHRKGQLDQQRHQEKVKEAIKKNLADIVSEESIIMSDGKQIIKVPIRSLDEYRFRFDHNKKKHGGQGEGNSQKGDVLGTERAGSKGPGKGKGAGEEPGTDYYEAEVSVEELAEIIFDDLELPNLNEKKTPDLEKKSIEFRDIRKKGLMGNIDKKRTLIENIKRNALNGEKGVGAIIPEDLRYKTWEEKIQHQSNAVVIAMMDTSGSMGAFEKYIARSFFFWTTRFLRTKYNNVRMIFVAHHTEAKEVTEDEFFTKGESGGTRCSSAYQLALEIIDSRYSPEDYNVYLFHFSDGDNLPSDNELCLRLVDQLVERCNMFGYGEIGNPYYSSSLLSIFKKVKSEKFTCVSIKDKNQVYKALKIFFSKGDE